MEDINEIFTCSMDCNSILNLQECYQPGENGVPAKCGSSESHLRHCCPELFAKNTNL